MAGTIILDARGLSCPQPAMMAKQAMKSTESDRIEVVVDNAAARDNIERIAKMSRWSFEIEKQPGEEYKLVLTR